MALQVNYVIWNFGIGCENAALIMSQKSFIGLTRAINFYSGSDNKT